MFVLNLPIKNHSDAIPQSAVSQVTNHLLRTLERSGRGRVRTHGLLKRFPIIGQLVNPAINDVYLTIARRPILAVVRRVIEDLQRHIARLPTTHAALIPRRFALVRAVSRRIGRLDPWEVDRGRTADRRQTGPSLAHRKRRGRAIPNDVLFGR